VSEVLQARNENAGRATKLRWQYRHPSEETVCELSRVILALSRNFPVFPIESSCVFPHSSIMILTMVCGLHVRLRLQIVLASASALALLVYLASSSAQVSRKDALLSGSRDAAATIPGSLAAAER
jgi:hypothetical protein